MADPRITVIVPTNRPPQVVAGCLAALSKQTVDPKRFEVLVLNDGSPHDLKPVARQFNREHGLQATVLDLPQGGPAAARNRGAETARGELLAFTDDDCVPEPNWLEAFEQASRRNPDALLGGRVYNLLRDRTSSEASQVLIDFLYRYYNQDPENARFFTSNNMAARREMVLRRGGFDAAFGLSAGEDRDFCTRWREQGGRLVCVDDARIGHAHNLTVLQFWNQHYRYGKGAAHYWQARKRAGSDSLSVEPLRFYLELMQYPLRRRPLRKGVPLTFLMALSQLANALGFFVEARRLPRLGKDVAKASS